MKPWLVVGAGFSGATIAERIATQLGEPVVVCDRMPYVGGTASDYTHASGLFIQRYGPHVFHTSSTRVWQYVQPFGVWRRHRYTVSASVDGMLVPLPLGFAGLRMLLGYRADEAQAALLRRYGPEARITVLSLAREPGILGSIAEVALDKLYRGYTQKHWGRSPSELSRSVLARVPIVVGNQAGYHRSPIEAVPVGGYTALIERMLTHPLISLQLGTPYHRIGAEFALERTIYTGAVDEFFGMALGRLPYRSVRFEVVIDERPKVLPVDTVNYPNDHAYTRVAEMKRITGQTHPKSALVYDYPIEHTEDTMALYPIPCDESDAITKQYEQLKARCPVRFCGRLGDYRYYNMDQAIGSALALFDEISGVPEVLGGA